MVKDIMVDMSERDLFLVDKSNQNLPIFDTVWGDMLEVDKEKDIEVLICNIIVPDMFASMIKYEDDELIIRFKSEYMPDTADFRIRPLLMKQGEYHLFENIRGVYGLPVNSYVLSKNIAAPISACMLPLIDIDGEFLIRMVKSSKSESLDKSYIYSSKESDIFISFSDDQASQLLSLCGPGNHYRYPTTGVGITKYLNTVIDHTDLYSALEAQFSGDKRSIQEAEFDNETGKLNLLFSPEKEETDNELEVLSNLNVDFFSDFTDEYVRRNVVIDEISDTEFVNILNLYPNVLSLLMFIDDTTSVSRIMDTVQSGKFNGAGEIEPSDEYFVVSASLEADTIIMFDDESEDAVEDAPIFIIDDTDESRLYTALVEQPYWITENCHKCFILKRRSVLRYMVKQENFRQGKGLFVVPNISSNIKNMIGLVQDENTGRLLGIVSNSTNISDISLEEITQHIYATQISL